MSVIRPSAVNQPPGTPTPVPAEPTAHESIAATWCREIAAAVAAAVQSKITDAYYLLARHDQLPAPRLLQVAFGTDGHRVDIDVHWPDPRQAPQNQVRVDHHAVAVDDEATRRPAIRLAHAAAAAILNAPPPFGNAAEPGTGVR